MKMKTGNLICLILFLSTIVVSCSVARHTLFTRDSTPSTYTKLGEAKQYETVKFIIALKQENIDKLEQIFNEITNPMHESYQNYKDINFINTLIAPKSLCIESVMNWLLTNEISKENIKNYGDAIEVNTNVQIASKLFETTFYYFQSNIKRDKIVIRSYGSYSIPKELAEFIQLVEGISNFPVRHFDLTKTKSSHKSSKVITDITATSRRLLQDDCQGTAIVPTVATASIYNLPEQNLNSALYTSQGVIEFEEQYYSPDDVDSFSSGIDQEVQNLNASQVVGPNNASNAQIEADLDIEFLLGTNFEAESWFWLETGNGWLYQYAVHFYSTEAVPQVASISYGWWEGDQCSVNPGAGECALIGGNSTEYVLRVNTEFMKIGARGITIVVASGDAGASSRSNDNCTIPQLRTEFPASSPYVLSVGATEVFALDQTFNPPDICTDSGMCCADSGPEQAVDYGTASFASGGGFSNITMRPEWQKSAVEKYFNNSSIKFPPQSYWNRNGRGVPDVAALGSGCLIYDDNYDPIDGDLLAVGGTSCSTPQVAGIVALLNQVSYQYTKKPLGFINPFIYQAFAAGPTTNFNDITQGDNTCTDNGCFAACKGFYAVAGWDAVSGVGSLNYQGLAKYIATMFDERKAKFGHY